MKKQLSEGRRLRINFTAFWRCCKFWESAFVGWASLERSPCAVCPSLVGTGENSVLCNQDIRLAYLGSSSKPGHPGLPFMKAAVPPRL